MDLWRHSYEPLQLPLLQKLKGKEEPSVEALAAYVAILKYMGDHPSRRQRNGTELTDLIFMSPLKYVSKAFCGLANEHFDCRRLCVMKSTVSWSSSSPSIRTGTQRNAAGSCSGLPPDSLRLHSHS